MSISVDQVFIKQFEADVHLAYQQMGTKLRSTIRSKTGVVGTSTTFQKVGRGIASTKSRHGIVPVMNLNHTPVECTLQDYYAGDWIDALDELKTNVDIDLSEWANTHDNVLNQIKYVLETIKDKMSGGAVLGLYNNLLTVLDSALPNLINDYGYVTEEAPNGNNDDYGSV